MSLMVVIPKSRYILALDPSGNYNEGSGTTGWVLFDNETDKICKFGAIKAGMYSNQMDYWDAHIALLDGLASYEPDIVMEDYLLYANKSQSQINSRFETPQLIGVIKYEAYKRGNPVHIQTAMQVKTRWTDEILAKKGYMNVEGTRAYIGSQPIVCHIRDAVRHAVHFKTYTSKYGKEN